jgi:inositol oxygenase
MADFPGALPSLDDWDDDVRRRYPEEGGDDFFRDYGERVRPQVREFYRENHGRQTVEFNLRIREKYLPLRTRRMGIWEAMRCLDELVDDSDPDTEVPQIEHAIQTAQAIRADGHPEWFVLAGLIHDLGKVLCLFGEPQWAVVGDTFPVGCAFSDNRLPGVLLREPGQRGARVPHAVRDVREGLRAGPGAHVVGAR